MSALPFNKIKVVLGATQCEYSVGDFLALPLNDRVKSILFGKLSFSQDGKPVNANDALKALRTHGAE